MYRWKGLQWSLRNPAKLWLRKWSSQVANLDNPIWLRWLIKCCRQKMGSSKTRNSLRGRDREKKMQKETIETKLLSVPQYMLNRKTLCKTVFFGLVNFNINDVIYVSKLVCVYFQAIWVLRNYFVRNIRFSLKIVK